VALSRSTKGVVGGSFTRNTGSLSVMAATFPAMSPFSTRSTPFLAIDFGGNGGAFAPEAWVVQL